MSDRKNRIKVLAAEADISLAELAKKIDVKPHTIRRYTRQEAQPRIELAEKIATVFGVHVNDVLGGQVISQQLPVPSSHEQMPAYGAVQAGLGFDITDVTAPIEMVNVPDYLENAPDPYAVYVTGDSMEPRFTAGELLYVHPGKPIRKNDYVVVQLNAQNANHAIVKRLVKQTNESLIVEQLSDGQTREIPAKDVISVHRVVGQRTVDV
tara:strand:- start:6087 stop:6713 length:627 start_codon:yes stop_codon:yes gene_type:complete